MCSRKLAENNEVTDVAAAPAAAYAAPFVVVGLYESKLTWKGDEEETGKEPKGD